MGRAGQCQLRAPLYPRHRVDVGARVNEFDGSGTVLPAHRIVQWRPMVKVEGSDAGFGLEQGVDAQAT